MGRFFSTVHIKNNTDRKGFIDSFCEAMKKRSFVPCKKGEAALSYLLAFSEGGWVTLSSDEYSDDPAKASDDVRQIAEEMKTSGFAVEVVDSDFATLKLFGGDHSDEVIVGDGSGYGIEEAPKGKRECWEQLLSEDKTWEQLSEAWERHEVFVEDNLCGAAPILGIESKYMTSDYGELSNNSDSDVNIVPLYFANEKDGKKSKPMTLNAAFIKVFGEGLEPFGFKRLKKTQNKFPFFVRAVGDEILQIVSYRTLTSSKLKHKCIEILSGIITLYRRNIDFTVPPANWHDLVGVKNLFDDFGDDINIEPSFMKKTVQELKAEPKPMFVKIDGKLCTVIQTLEETFRGSIGDFHCKTDDVEQMLHDLEKAFNAVKGVILPVFDKVTDLNSCIAYKYKLYGFLGNMILCPFDEFVTNSYYSCSDALILIKAGYRDNDTKRMEKVIINSLKIHLAPHDDPVEVENRLRIKYEKSRSEQVAFRNEILDDPELYKRALEELERCKAENIEKLKAYGLF